MKKIILPIIFCLLLSVNLLANDGVFYAQGNTLIPLQETQIQLKKEVLKFFVVDYSDLKVEIDFEFFNPSKAKTVTVGFVTPPAEGDISDQEAKHPFIKNFTVNVNGKVLPFKIKRMSQTSFKMGDSEVEGNDFVYYFPVTFKKGLNKIRHTYRYRGSSGVELSRAFDYQITTGKRWANRQIDDFNLEIHLDQGIFAVPASFWMDGKSAEWKIVGNGVMDETPRQWFAEENPKVRMVHLKSGYLSLQLKNFKPDNDIFFGEYNWAAGWSKVWCSEECAESESLEKIVRFIDPDGEYQNSELAELSPKELKYVRNYFYAMRGFPFKDAELKKFYGQFFWYRPDEKVTLENIRLSTAESNYLKRLKQFEDRRKP
jgi:hypothetical protein